MGMSNGNDHVMQLFAGMRLADLLCQAYGKAVVIELMKVSPDQRFHISIGGWAGGDIDPQSRATFVGPTKAAELLFTGSATGLSLTPTLGFVMGLGWMGGARWDEWIVAVSKLSEEHDRLIALIVLYALKYATILHHIGVRYPTLEEMMAASAAWGDGGITVPAVDHVRIYHLVDAPNSPIGKYWREFQYFPDGPITPATHWDVATADPVGFLRFVAGAYGTEPVLWDDAGPNDPVGVVWIPDSKGNVLGVMARPRWVAVETW
ncbi:hypothetical protein COY32_04640 [candidate division WWE3 bacterium CG_4_10_14_0_2_um_filter_41_14]|uniref:Uncharacterized protein n=1 Tax=candidate division WWE3 bacterium CG_4_10_14_0_2_um_filter_41_14 TaxID=1975072 RepID=A0A2M7THL4_UNCKA|nr:MAG: hypothetical protein COY32_04640 [candidate division WWE3 bacterium CG_4_10_14_0_2_um_filter_41_14]